MSASGKKLLDQFSVKKIIIPVIIGLGVLVYVFIEKFDREAFAAIEWSWFSLFWLFMAIVMIAVRQFTYMWRIRFLTDNKLSWRSSFEVIMLWEFGSAATPSSVGGTAVALFLLTKENINPGKTAAIVLSTILLDMLFLLFTLVVFLIVLDLRTIFPKGPMDSFNISFFLITFVLLLGYTFLVLYGLFINPRGLKWLLIKFLSVKFLRKWRYKAVETGNQLVSASSELKHKSVSFWVKTFLLTTLSWSARFLVVNCLILIVVDFHAHITLYARQLALMIMLMMSPTPGGSGVAELSFPGFINDLVPTGLVATITALWRTFTYYPYLFLGLIILPRWVGRVYAKR